MVRRAGSPGADPGNVPDLTGRNHGFLLSGYGDGDYTRAARLCSPATGAVRPEARATPVSQNGLSAFFGTRDENIQYGLVRMVL